MATPYLIKIKNITVAENGFLEDENHKVKVNNGLVLTLHHPNVARPAVASTRTLKLQDNVLYDYTQESHPKQVVFKEEILDETYLEIELTSIEKASKINKIFHKIFKTAFSTATSLLPGGAIVTAASKTAVGSVFELIEPNDKVAVIGRFGGTISEARGSGVPAVLPLDIPKEVKIKKRGTNEQGQVVFIQKTLHKGMTNGQIELEITQL